MTRDRLHFLLLNIGHFLDHLFMLIFATVAALALNDEWGISYSGLLAYATPGFLAFGLFAVPAGWLADRWSRDGMMVLFFWGMGLASIATALANSPLQIGIGLFVIGMFASIYHPVGLAIVTLRWRNIGMRIAANGVWGNLGVASAALLTGYMIDNSGWRMAFVWPGVFSVIIGCGYLALRWRDLAAEHRAPKPVAEKTGGGDAALRRLLFRVTVIVFVTTAVSSIIFQSTTFALPKIFDERLQGLVSGFGDRGATAIGFIAFVVFATASMAQLAVGAALDRYGPRQVFRIVASVQLVCFLAMPGLRDGWALLVALGFMLGAFGQIPINDFMIGKMASGAARARIYGIRYVVSFTVLAATLPMIAFVYDRWGFDMLFAVLASAALVILIAVSLLPRKLPSPA